MGLLYTTEAFGAKNEKDAGIFVSIFHKLACFLEAVEDYNLSHMFKGRQGIR